MLHRMYKIALFLFFQVLLASEKQQLSIRQQTIDCLIELGQDPKKWEKDIEILLEPDTECDYGTIADFKETLYGLISHINTTMPKEYRTYIECLKMVFPEKDGQIDYTKSYKDAKETIIPLVDQFYELTSSEKTHLFFKSLESYRGCFMHYGIKLTDQHIDRKRIMPGYKFYEPGSYEKLKYEKNDDSFRYFINRILDDIDTFFLLIKDHGYDTAYLRINISEIDFIFSQPQEIIDTYCYPHFQKLIFPFYFIGNFFLLINACKGEHNDAADKKTHIFKDTFSDEEPFINVLQYIFQFKKFRSANRFIEFVHLMSKNILEFDDQK